MNHNNNEPSQDNIKIYVINLDKRKDRLQKIKNNLDDLDLKFTRFSAILPEDAHNFFVYKKWVRRLTNWGIDLTTTEMACYASHLAVMENMIHDNIPIALILEDDAIIHPGIKTVLNEIVQCNISEKYDMIRFFDKKKTFRRIKYDKSLPTSGKIYRFYGAPGGAFGYILTHKCASQIIESAKKAWLPIDIFLGMTWTRKIKTRTLLPVYISTDYSGVSSLEDDRKSAKSCNVYIRFIGILFTHLYMPFRNFMFFANYYFPKIFKKP